MFSVKAYQSKTFEVELADGEKIHLRVTSKSNLESIIEELNVDDISTKLNVMYDFAHRLLNDNTEKKCIERSEVEEWDIFLLSEFFKEYLNFVTGTVNSDPN